MASTLALFLIVGVLTGCTAPMATRVHGTSARVSPDGSTTLAVPGGPTVTLPPGASSGSGQVVVSPLVSDGLSGWTIKLQGGANLVGTATLSFPISKAKGAPAPAVGYNERPGEQIKLVHGKVEGDRYVVKTNHFSNWFIDLLDHLKQEILGWAAEAFAGVRSPTVPSCSGWPALASLGYASTTTGTRLINHCLGADGGSPQIKLASRLGSPQIVETMPGLSVQRMDTSLDNAFPKLIAEIQAVKRSGDNIYFLAPKDTMVLDAAKGTSTALNVSPSGAGYLASVLVLAAKLVTQLSGFTGATRTAKDVQTALEGQDCMSSIIEQAVAKNVTSGLELAEYASDLVPPVFRCAATFMKEGTKGFIVGEIVGWFEWIAEAVQSVASAAVGALASILEPNGATIAVNAPAATAWLWTVPHVTQQHSGNRVRDNTGDTAFSSEAVDATEQWVGCAGAVATTTYAIDEAWSTWHWAFGVQRHAPVGMNVRLSVLLDGRVTVNRVVRRGAPDNTLTDLDVTGVQRLVIKAQTSDSCSAASTGYGAFLDSYFTK